MSRRPNWPLGQQATADSRLTDRQPGVPGPMSDDPPIRLAVRSAGFGRFQPENPISLRIPRPSDGGVAPSVGGGSTSPVLRRRCRSLLPLSRVLVRNGVGKRWVDPKVNPRLPRAWRDAPRDFARRRLVLPVLWTLSGASPE